MGKFPKRGSSRCLLKSSADILQPTDDLESLIGDTMTVKFLEVDEEQERVVFSARRAHSETFTSGFKVRVQQIASLPVWQQRSCGSSFAAWSSVCINADADKRAAQR